MDGAPDRNRTCDLDSGGPRDIHFTTGAFTNFLLFQHCAVFLFFTEMTVTLCDHTSKRRNLRRGALYPAELWVDWKEIIL